MQSNQEKLLDNFTAAINKLDSVLAEMPETGLDWSSSESEWTIRHIIHHLADDYNVFTHIIERALATPSCKVFFGGFPGNDVWAEQLSYDQRPVRAALDLIHAKQAFIKELIIIFPNRWENTVSYHNESGERVSEQSVWDMVTMLTNHLQEHNLTIEKILSANQS